MKKIDKKEINELRRDEDSSILGGVALGISNYFNIEVNIVRVIFVLLVIFNPSWIFVYLILWVLLPSNLSDIKNMKGKVENKNLKDKTLDIVENIKLAKQGESSRFWIGFSFLVFGVVFLLQNLGYDVDFILKFWPLILIVLGILFFKKHE